MPRLSKDSIRQFARTGCEKQLRISMHPTTKRFRAERTQLRLPEPQIRPALQAMTAAGEEWGRQKVGELEAAFGDDALLGARRRTASSASSSTPVVDFGPSLLKDHLPQARPGRFLIECGYRVDTATFRSAHNLNAVVTPETGTPFTIEDARPDVIEVLLAEECANTVTISGDVVPHDDDRMALRVIDVKLSSEPGPQYFAELAYYVLALAAWLRDTGWDEQFVVSADAAVWPGNEGVSRLGQAVQDAASASSIRAAFHDDLVEAPQRVFVATVLRILRDHIPRVLRTPLPDLPWAVTTQCQGCEHLGQQFTNIDSEGASAPKAGHCIPTAEREQNLSRLPFLSRGAFKVLRKHGIDDVPAVADLGPEDPTYRQHHRLRGQRSIVGSRARALGGGEELPLHPEATTTAIPAWAKLRIYVSADFDPGSARTLAFGLHWRWVSKDEKPTLDPYPRVHYTAANTDDDEWLALSALLEDLHQLLSEAAEIDPNTTVQVYVWDTVTFEHLTRVIGRHLDRILDSGHLNRLAWMFPPETVIQNVKLAATPVVSVIRDAVVGLLTLPLPHTYNLLGAARLFHRDQVRSSFRVPPYWDDPFSDQIPPERAHQLWNGRTTVAGPSPDEVVGWLHETVRTKLFAMNAVADALTEQMRGRLPRRAPRVTALRPPTDEVGLSHLGLLLLTHARLNAAISAIDIARTRSQHVEEREASFEAARLRSRVTGSRRIGILTRLGLPTTAAYEVFEINAASVEVKAGSGDFLWSVLPESMTHRGGESFDFTVRSAGGQPFGAARDARRSLADVFAVTVEHIDRVQRILVVQFSSYGGADRQRQRLRSLGVVSLDADLVLDRLSADFFTSKLRTTLHAIGNPEGVLPDPQVARAMNLTRTPRQRGRPPVAEFLWNAAAVADTVTPLDLGAARRVISAHGHRLNEPQQRAWEHALSHRLTLIWGPPGTGKTATLRAILAALAAGRAAGTPKRIVLTANNYNAIDTVLRPLVEQLRAAGDTTPVRRLRSESRADVGWLNAEENVATDNRNAAALEATAQLLTDGAIVTGPPQQLHKLLTTAYGSATADVFDVLVIDEASQMDVANASLALAGAAPDASVIVAGDPLQLPPIHASEPPAGFEHLVGSVYEFFARHHGIPEQHLEINYRSNADIVALARRAGYSDRLQAASPTRRVQYVVPPADAVPSGWPATMVWDPTLRTIADPDRSTVAVTYPEGTSGQWNNFEAGLVAALVATYRLHAAATLTDDDTIPEVADDVAFWTSTIGIVTPHRAQRSLVVRELVNAFASEPHQTHLRPLIENAVDTVERFQGQERDIIIGTYAVGDPDTIAEEDEFLLNLNRFNVMATRARAKLIVIATDELVGHISADLDVVRSSEMLKDFVAAYCNTEKNAPVTVRLTSRAGRPPTTIVQPTVAVRWRQSGD